MCGKRLARWWREVVPVQDRMQAIANLRALGDQTLAVANSRSQFAHMHRGDPDGRHQIGRKPRELI
jgi:hypothetical protein